MTGHLSPDVDTRCEFRTAHEVTIQPLKIETDVDGRPRYFDRDLDLLRLPSALPLKGALRLRLKLSEDSGSFAEMEGLDELDFFLRGDVSVAGRIFEELFSQATHLVCVESGKRPESGDVHLLGGGNGPRLIPKGTDAEEALLPVDRRVFEGYRLLREYMALPQRLLFFKLAGLRRALAKVKSGTVDLIICFKRSSPEISKILEDGTFVLNATPVVNLFERRTDQVAINQNRAEFHLVVDRTKPLHHEVMLVSGVNGVMRGSAARMPFEPFYRSGSGNPDAKAFFTIRREKRLLTAREKREGSMSNYLGSEVFLSLVDGASAPFNENVEGLSVRVLCSNRHLPLSMPLKGRDTDLLPEAGLALSSICWLVPPTAPLNALAERSNAWRFISHLSLNYLSLVEQDGGGVEALRELMSIYRPDSMSEAYDWIEGIESVNSEAAVRRMEGGGPVAFQRGLKVDLLFNERRFAGSSAFLFGSVLARFLANHVTVNSFVETRVSSLSRGHLITWPPRRGNQSLV